MTSDIASRLRDLLDRHPRAIAAGVVGGALVLVAAAVVLAIGTFNPPPTAEASPIPGASVRPSASTTAEASPKGESPEPSATLLPTAVPTLGFEAPAGILPPSSRVVVAVEALQLRAEPGLGAASVGVASAGEEFLLAGIYGPIMRDGLAWYRLTRTPAFDELLWAAAGSGADQYLHLLPPRCEIAEPDLPALVSMNDWDRLACFGDHPLTFTATYGCPVCGVGAIPPGTYEPSWLAGLANLNSVGWPDVLMLHFPPEAGLDAPPNASIVRVSGHFNDPASTTCELAPGDPPMPADPVTAELFCREQFVVDGYEIIGTDPDFTYDPGSGT